MKKEKGFTPLEISGEKISKIKKRRFLTGFTLIELLLVIAIIGLLASIVFVSARGVKAKARDAKREVEVASVAKSLEMYFLEKWNYPVLTDWTSLEEDADTNGVFSQEMEEFLTATPRDSLYGQTSSGGEPYSYQYLSSSEGDYYAIKVVYETKGPESTEEVVIVYSSPEGESVLGGGGGLAEQIAEALDHPELYTDYGLTLGGVPWSVDETDFHTGGSSAKTGVVSLGQSTYIDFQIDNNSVIHFRWNSPAELTNDRIRVISTLDGVVTHNHNVIGGGGWNTANTGTYPAGATVRVEYMNDGTEQGWAWLDNLYFTDN